MKILNDQAQLVPVGELKLHPRNPNSGDIDVIADSIKTNGFYGALVAQESTGYILKGNHTFQAAQRLGMEQVPVMWVDTDDATALKILLVDNRAAEFGVRSPEQLATLLQELAATDTLFGTGYDQSYLQDLLDQLADSKPKAALTDPDDAPPVPAVPTSQLGDIWLLGEHRVGCGDSTDATWLAKVLGGALADLVWTDPPYNVNYEGKTKDKLKIANDAMTPEQFRAFLLAAFQATLAIARPGACIYVAYATIESENFHAAFREAGWYYSQDIIWVKNSATMSRQDYNWRHEPLLYGWKPGAGHFYCQDFKQTTVIDAGADYASMEKAELVKLLEQVRDASDIVYVDKPNRNDLHPTMKPVALVKRFIENSSRPREIVFDPFGGSGSTLMAAESANRHTALNELDPRYVDVIVKRWQEHTGQQATLEASGQTFTAVALERGQGAT